MTTTRAIKRTREITVSGFDHHNGLYYYNLFLGGMPAPPLPPVPIPPGFLPVPPFSFHQVFFSAHDWQMDDKSNANVLADGYYIVSKDHEARLTLHIPPGANLAIPLIIAFGTGKWKLATHSVLAGSGPLASTIDASYGSCLNCNDPFSVMFLNAFWAPGSVHLRASFDDWWIATVEWGVSAGIELAFNIGFKMGGDAAKRLLFRKLSKDIRREAAERAARDAVDKVLRDHGKRYVFEEVFEKDGRKAAQEVNDKILSEGHELIDDVADKAADEARRLLEQNPKLTPEEAAKQAAEKVTREWLEEKGSRDAAQAGKKAGDAAAKDVDRQIKETFEENRPVDNAGSGYVEDDIKEVAKKPTESAEGAASEEMRESESRDPH